MYQLVEKLATTSTGVSVTGLVACTTMNVGSTIAITGVLDEDAMGSDSAVSLATQQSIKAYVDTQVATQLANIVEDITPQLGGNLDVNGKDITSPDGTDLIDIVDGAIDIQTASTSRLDINDSGVRMGASGSRVTTILDEDAMGTDSDTALATQQSIKAYVDASSASGISNVVEDTTPQLGGDLDMNGKGIDFPTTANITDCLDEDNMA
jgi:predicted transcriptional regulator